MLTLLTLFNMYESFYLFCNLIIQKEILYHCFSFNKRFMGKMSSSIDLLLKIELPEFYK